MTKYLINGEIYFKIILLFLGGYKNLNTFCYPKYLSRIILIFNNIVGKYLILYKFYSILN